jgi:UDP-glucose 4-epimerase
MKILVTGGAGFIGSHIVDAYIKRGHDVVVVDDLSTGQRQFVNAEARLVELNIGTEEVRLDQLFKQERFDLVNHHAAQVDPRVSVANPCLDANSNIIGTLNLLQCCVRYDVRQFIFISSGGVLYGNAERLPTSEESPKLPLSPYGVSKLAVEHYLFSHRLNWGINYLALRYANVYGPRQTPKSEATVISTFVRQMLKNETPIIFGDGKQTRDYIFITDVVAANLLASEQLTKLNRSTPGQLDDLAFNIGTGLEISVNEIFLLLRQHLDFRGEPQLAPARNGEILRSALSYAKAEKLLGFRPKMDLKTGLRETIAWLQADRSIAQPSRTSAVRDE